MNENEQAEAQGFLWMKGAFPLVSAKKVYGLVATHAMTHLEGECAKPHEHHYLVFFCYTHEINPHKTGYTHDMRDLDGEFRPLLDRLHDKHLNDVLPCPPSAEMLALWLLANTQPAYCDAVEITCYSGFHVRAERPRQRSEWLARLRA